MDKIQLTIGILGAIAIISAVFKNWAVCLAIVTLLGGILIPSPIGVQNAGNDTDN